MPLALQAEDDPLLVRRREPRKKRGPVGRAPARRPTGPRFLRRLSPAHKQRIIRVTGRGAGNRGLPGRRHHDAPRSGGRRGDIASTQPSTSPGNRPTSSCWKKADGAGRGRCRRAQGLCQHPKYIRMGASSNFGNMFSVLGASVSCRSCRCCRFRSSPTTFSTILADGHPHGQRRSGISPIPAGGTSKHFRNSCCSSALSSIFDYATFFMMLYCLPLRGTMLPSFRPVGSSNRCSRRLSSSTSSAPTRFLFCKAAPVGR